jgi:hypothetical protein
MKVKNKVIWYSAGAISEMGNVLLPVKVSLEVARLNRKVLAAREPIEEVYKKLITQYGTKKNAGGQSEIAPDNPNMESFSRAFTELMDAECPVEWPDAKIKLPEKIAGTCDKCHHNLDVTFTIKTGILLALEDFVEVV